MPSPTAAFSGKSAPPARPVFSPSREERRRLHACVLLTFGERRNFKQKRRIVFKVRSYDYNLQDWQTILKSHDAYIHIIKRLQRINWKRGIK
jgi:hypothetical protein